MSHSAFSPKPRLSCASLALAVIILAAPHAFAKPSRCESIFTGDASGDGPRVLQQLADLRLSVDEARDAGDTAKAALLYKHFHRLYREARAAQVDIDDLRLLIAERRPLRDRQSKAQREIERELLVFEPLKLLKTPAGHSELVAHGSFSLDGKRFVSTGRDGLAILWDTNTWTPLLTLDLKKEDLIEASLDATGERILVYLQFGVTAVYDSSGRRLLHNPKSDQFASSAKLTPDGRSLVYNYGNTDTIVLQDVDSGTKTELHAGGLRLKSVDISPDGSRLFATTFKSKEILSWDLATHRPLASIPAPTATLNGTERYPITFSADGRRLIRQGTSEAEVWDLSTGQKLFDLPGGTGIGWPAVFSPDGRWIATQTDTFDVAVWDSATGHAIARTSTNGSEIRTMAFNREGNALAFGSTDGLVRIIDTRSGDHLQRLRAAVTSTVVGSPWVMQIEYSPRTDELAVMTADKAQPFSVWGKSP